MNKTFKEFLVSKSIEDKAFNELGAEEKAGLYIEYNTELKEYIDTLEKNVDGKATKEDLAKAVQNLNDSHLEQMKVLNKAMEEMGLSIKAFTEGTKKKDEHKTLKQFLTENLDKLKVQKNGQRSEVEANRVSFEVNKVVGNITSANISGGNVPVEQRLAGFDTIASRRIRLMDLVTRGRAVSNIISWVSQANKDGAAGQTSEGATKNQIDFDLVVDSASLKKTTAFIKVSTEMLDDVDFIQSEINNELEREVLKKIEEGVYEGDGTGNNLNGIRTVATAFSAGTFANTVDNANEVDVLTVAANQIAIAEQEEPSAILMHPSDVTNLLLIKVSTTDRRYVDRLIMVAGNLMLDGIPIVKTTLVTAGEYLIGNFKDALVFDKGGVTYDIGLDGNDFTKNMRTILAEWRGLVIVKTNRRTSFVKGVFATDKAVLETT